MQRTRHKDNYNDRVTRAVLELCTCYKKVEEEGVKSILRKGPEQLLEQVLK